MIVRIWRAPFLSGRQIYCWYHLYWKKWTNVSSSVFDTCVLLLLVYSPAFGTGCAFANSVCESQTDPGTISDTLKI